jgi:quercetin dioxygenase-like cupin family protein
MTKKTILAISTVAVGLAAASFAAGIAVAKGAAKGPELTTLGELAWTPIMKEGPLPAVSPIEGDGLKGAYMGYLKLPAGFESPPHMHTNEYWAVLVQGQMTHWATDGGSEKDSKAIGPGGWVHMPAKTAHVSKCYPGVECIMVTMQKGKFDFIPAPPKK